MTMTRVAGVDPGQRRLNGVQTSGRTYRNLSEVAFGVTEEHDLAVPVRDGARLMADVLRPEGDGRHPALVAFAPFPRQLMNSGAPLAFVEAGASDFFVPRGYAHVLVNARGTCGSDGVFTFGDEQERRDLYDVIEWVAAQPWCDGNVGMIGVSYFAIAQLGAATTRPPHLRAIFPFAGTVDVYRGAAWHGGMFSSGFLGPFTVGMGIASGQRPEFFRGAAFKALSAVLRTDVVHRRFESFNGEAALPALAKVMRGAYAADPWDKLYFQAAVEHPLYDAFWAERDLRDRLATVDIPVYLGCDWANVPLHLPGTFHAWRALSHQGPVRMTVLQRGGLLWPWESMHIEALAWFDRWLKGRDTGIDEGDPIRYWLAGADEFRTARAWPPEGVRWDTLNLRADASLAPGAEPDGAREYLFLPASLERPAHANAPSLPDRLHWETLPRETPVDIVGPIALELDASATGMDVDWIAKLELVTADGEVSELTQGWLRASHRATDPARSLPGEPWHPHDRFEPVTPGAVTRYSIGLVATAQRVLPGERLRLTLTSHDRGIAMCHFEHAPLAYPSRQTVLPSSRLVLPVIDAQHTLSEGRDETLRARMRPTDHRGGSASGPRNGSTSYRKS
jgi:putative CocE/NonD family hydrolase